MINAHSNYEWFLKQDFSKYSGKWLAIVDKKVIASGKDPETLIRKTHDKYPHKRPFITKVVNKLSVL